MVVTKLVVTAYVLIVPAGVLLVECLLLVGSLRGRAGWTGRRGRASPSDADWPDRP